MLKNHNIGSRPYQVSLRGRDVQAFRAVPALRTESDGDLGKRVGDVAASEAVEAEVARGEAFEDRRASTWSRCYYHNFLRFPTIFWEKLAFFSKTNVMIKFLRYLHCIVLSQKLPFFANFFGENIFKITTSVPGHVLQICEIVTKLCKYL
jgi:hypothetical protein